MKKLVLETTAPFQGLAELVAYDEGLFEKEGLIVEWADREKDVEKKTRVDVTSPDVLDPHSSVQSGRQVGRRAIVTFAGLVVRPDSSVYTPQQLANRLVGVPFYFGTHYLALHMLEGFLPRDQIKVCSAPNGSRYRYDSMMKGEIEATTLTEPYLSLAERNGCRVVATAFYHGTEVASDKVDADTYTAFNRAVREAVKRINADKRKYLQYFIDYHKEKDPEIGTLTVDDLRESRIVVVDPAPIPADELERTYNWIKSWGMLGKTDDHNALVNMDVQQAGHAAAE